MIMRSRRVREDTPQPTIRVTEGICDLSMFYRRDKETKKKHGFRNISHTHTHIHRN